MPQNINGKWNEFIIYKVEFLQKSFNNHKTQDILKSSRITVKTERLKDESSIIDYTDQKTTSSDINKFVGDIISKIRHIANNSEIRIFNDSWEVIEVNNQVALCISFMRKIKNNPTEKVIIYWFKRGNILQSLSMSYLEQDTLKCGNDFKKVLNSLRLSTPEDVLKIEDVINQNNIKIDTLRYNEFSVGGYYKYYICEFGEIKIPKGLIRSDNYDTISNIFTTYFFQNQILPLTKSARISISTQAGLGNEILENSKSLEMNIDELNEFNFTVKNGYIQLNKTNGIEILQWEDTRAVSINKQNALMFSYISQLSNYPPNINSLYSFDNFDRKNSVTLSYPVKNSAICRAKFESVINSIRLVNIYN